MRWTVATGVVLASIPLGAEPTVTPAPAYEQVRLESRGAASASRVYRIEPDLATGRLVRLSSRVQAAAPTQSRTAVGTRAVVQGGFGKRTQVQGLDLNALVRRTARQFDLEPELIHAVIRQESGHDPFAVSHKGAKGLMQLMPATAKRFGIKDVFDPAENVQGGVKYLRQLLDRYDGDRRLALAAYNAGEGAVDRYGGVPPYPETQDYVERIVGPGDADAAADAGALESDRPIARRVVAMERDGTLLFEAH